MILQGICVQRISNRLRMRSLDFSGESESNIFKKQHLLLSTDFRFFYEIKAKSELKRSAVADNESGKSKLSEVRTSSGMFITKAKVFFFLSIL